MNNNGYGLPNLDDEHQREKGEVVVFYDEIEHRGRVECKSCGKAFVFDLVESDDRMQYCPFCGRECEKSALFVRQKSKAAPSTKNGVTEKYGRLQVDKAALLAALNCPEGDAFREEINRVINACMLFLESQIKDGKIPDWMKED